MEIGEPNQVVDVFLCSDSEFIYFSEKNKTDLNPNYTNPQILIIFLIKINQLLW